MRSMPARKRSLEKNNREAYLLLIPWFIGLIGFGLIPICFSLYISFSNYTLIRAPVFVGIDNYVRMFQDDMFRRSLRVTFTYVFLAVPLALLTALAIALALVKAFKGVGMLRAVFYLPSLLGGSIAIAVLWRILFAQTGLVNQILSVFGIQGHSWIGDPRYALYTLVLLRMWQFGSAMLIFIAGMKQIPESLYESANIEGAGYFQKLFHITLPMLSPIILFNAIMNMISAFQDFTPAFIVSGGTGGPMSSTLFYSLFLYQRAFASFQMGYAASMAWFLLVIIASFTFILFKTSAKRVYYES